MKVTMPGGEVNEGATPNDVIDQMRAELWTVLPRDEYMRKLAEDVQGATGRVIHTDDPLRFLFDLEQVGVILSVEYLSPREAERFNQWTQDDWTPDTQPGDGDA
jgi:hypothetical protein